MEGGVGIGGEFRERVEQVEQCWDAFKFTRHGNGQSARGNKG